MAEPVRIAGLQRFSASAPIPNINSSSTQAGNRDVFFQDIASSPMRLIYSLGFWDEEDAESLQISGIPNLK